MEVEKCVLDLERVEGPLHEIEAALQRVLPLRQLHAASQATVSVLLANGEHVRVQVEMAVTVPGNRERKADELRALEAADDLAADLFRDHEHAQRDEVGVGKV